MSKTIFILGAGASYSHSNKEFPLINDIFKVAKQLRVTSYKDDEKNILPIFECVDLYIKKNFNCQSQERYKYHSKDIKNVF